MREIEYRMASFKEKCSRFKDKNIILYGTGINAKVLLDNFPDYNIMGLMDQNKEGKFIYGKKVLSQEEVIELQADVIIIAAQIDSAQIVYHRIVNFCITHHILLYDIYGNNIVKMRRQLLYQEISYCKYNEDYLIEKIKEYDIISFDFMDTLVMRDVISQIPIFNAVLSKAETQGLNIPGFIEMRSKMVKDRGGDYTSLDDIYGLIGNMADITKDDEKILIGLEREEQKKHIVLRKAMKKVLNAAISKGKKVYIISDQPLLRDDIVEILEEIKGPIELLIEYESGCTKYNGLYRKLIESEKAHKYLHIGDNSVADGIAPLTYGMDAFVIKSGAEILNAISESCSPNIETFTKECIIEKGIHISEEFNNPFVMCQMGKK